MRHVLVVAVLLAAVACGSDAAQPTVEVADFSFSPEAVKVDAGTAVTWRYGADGKSLHTVTFEDGEESGDLHPGEDYQRTFQQAGQYAYVCFYHPGMTGVVTVAD